MKKEKKFYGPPLDPHKVEDLRELYIDLMSMPPETVMYVAGYIHAVRDMDALKQ